MLENEYQNKNYNAKILKYNKFYIEILYKNYIMFNDNQFIRK